MSSRRNTLASELAAYPLFLPRPLEMTTPGSGWGPSARLCLMSSVIPHVRPVENVLPGRKVWKMN